MTEHDIPNFDGNRLAELMAEYAQASTREREREIETEVLQETVWKIDKEPFAMFTEQEWAYICDRVDVADDKRAESLLRRPYLRFL